MKNRAHILTTTLLALGLCALCPAPKAFAVVPAPDGGYPGGNTAEGQSALLSLSTGMYNTGVGIYSLLSVTDGNFNTGVGAGTLLVNTASQNTATGAGALLSNSTGAANAANGTFTLFSNTSGSGNTATGTDALFSNTTGGGNTATGLSALQANIGGENNTAIGAAALFLNTAGNSNTAVGQGALFSNISGDNTATGVHALFSNTTGFFNTATGEGALEDNTDGGGNTAIGYFALHNNTTGSGNIAIGVASGVNLTAGDNNIYIGNVGLGGDSNTTRIGIAKTTENTFIDGIHGATIDPATALIVGVDASGKLGTTASSRRFKDDIKPIDKASEAILSLKPVTFHYKTDAKATPCFGLIAEEVEKVSPELVVHDTDGKPYSVRYDQVNAMLLNEFLKEHKAFVEEQRKVQEQAATVARLEKEMQTVVAHAKEQDSQIQRVSAQIEVSKPAPQVAGIQR